MSDLKTKENSECLRENMAYQAFSLVELLVVIAVISVLAGLLFPALENAMEGARSISCMNNLRQWGVGFSMYSDDFNDEFPRTRAQISGVWTGTIKNQDGWAAILAPAEMSFDLPIGSYFLPDEIPVGTTAICPSIDSRMWNYSGFNISGERWRTWSVPTMYSANFAWASDSFVTLKPGHISRSDFPILLDAGPDAAWNQFGYNTISLTYSDKAGDFYIVNGSYLGNSYVSSFPGFWHGTMDMPLTGSCNQLCLDGSVSIIHAESVSRYFTNTNTNCIVTKHPYFFDKNNSQELP